MAVGDEEAEATERFRVSRCAPWGAGMGLGHRNNVLKFSSLLWL
jgi:hypothetical protein